MSLLLKISGEFFSAKDELTDDGLCFLDQLKLSGLTSGYIVVGGGNRIRGNASSLSRNTSDKLGVISTIFNAFVLQEYLAIIQVKSVVFSHFEGFGVMYSSDLAMAAYEDGNWVILAGGLGCVGYVSTDLSSVIKSLELGVDAMLKITKADGVFDRSPEMLNSKILHKVSYDEVLEKKLSVVDLSAVAIAAENDLPIGVCSIRNFPEFMQGGAVGSVIGYDWRS